MRSVPEVVSAHQHLWANLPVSVQEQLGYGWVDRAARSHLPVSFERAGWHALADTVRRFERVSDGSSLTRLCEELRGMELPDAPVDALAAFFDLVASLDALRTSFSIADCFFCALMASRFAFGDDRVLTSLRDALAPRVDSASH